MKVSKSFLFLCLVGFITQAVGGDVSPRDCGRKIYELMCMMQKKDKQICAAMDIVDAKCAKEDFAGATEEVEQNIGPLCKEFQELEKKFKRTLYECGNLGVYLKEAKDLAAKENNQEMISEIVKFDAGLKGEVCCGNC